MCATNTIKMKNEEKHKLEFEKALELRNFEIENFWKRGWFFGALLIALFTAYIKLNNQFIPSVCLSFLIMIISLSQCLMNRGSKYWQERWEYITKNRESLINIDLTKTKKINGYERCYIDACIQAKDENKLTISRRFSVSKLTFLVWDLIFISCICIWANDVIKNFSLSIDWRLTSKIFFYHLIIIIYIICFWEKGSVYEKFKNKEDIDNNSQKKNKFFDDSEIYVTNSFLKNNKD